MCFDCATRLDVKAYFKSSNYHPVPTQVATPLLSGEVEYSLST